jgi:hypothetical protein
VPCRPELSDTDVPREIRRFNVAPRGWSFSEGYLTRQDDLILLSITVIADMISAGNAHRCFATAVGGSQPSADSGPSSGVAAPVGALRRLNVRASDQRFLPIHYAFTQEARPPRALKSVRDPVSRARTVQLPKSSAHAHDGRLDSVGFRRPRGSESG